MESDDTPKPRGMGGDLPDCEHSDREKSDAGKYEAIINATRDAIIVFSKGIISEWNNGAEQLFGWTKGEARGKSVYDFITKKDSGKKSVVIGKNMELDAVHKDGHEFPVELVLSSVEIDGQTNIVSVVRDISKRRKTEEKLKDSEERYRELIENSKDPIFAFNPDETYRFANSAFSRPLGKTPDSIIGKTPYDIFPQNEAEKRLALVRQVFKSGERGEIEVKVATVSGGNRTFLTSVDPAKDEDENTKYVTCISKDITEHKQAGDALAQQNDLLSRLNHFSVELLNMSDGKSLEEFITKELKEITGAEVAIFAEYNPSTRTTTPKHIEMEPGLIEKVIGLLGKKINKIQSVISEEMYREMTTEMIGMRGTLHEVTNGAVSPFVGKAIQLLLGTDRFFGLAYFVEGELYGTSMIAIKKGQPDPQRNVLENFVSLATLSLRRKRAEDSLKQNEEKYRSLAEGIKDVTYTADIEGNLTYIGPQVSRYGLNPADMIGRNLISFIHPDDHEQVIKDITGTIQTGKEVLSEFRVVDKDGNIHWFEEAGGAERDKTGAVIRLTGVMRDITERRQAEEKLKKTLYDLKKSQSIAHIGSWEFNLASGTFTGSDEITRLLGFPSDSQIDYREISECIVPEDREYSEKGFANLMQTGETFTNVARMAKKDTGEIRDFLAISELQRDKDGNPVSVIGVNQDITERRRAEEALRQSEERFRLLFNSGRDAIAVHLTGEDGKPTNFVQVNDVACEKLGYTRDEMLRMSPQDIDSPDHSWQMPEVVGKLLQDGQVLFETEHITKDGRRIPVEISSVLFQFDNIPATMSVARDISERKKIEKVLIEKERLSAIGEMVSGVAHDFNNGLQTILGGIEMGMADSTLSPEGMADLGMAKQSALDASARVRQIQRFAGKNRESSEYELVDIKSVIEDAVAQSKYLWKDTAQKQGLAIDLIINCQDNLNTSGNPGELRTVLINLIKNSIEAMPDGGTISIDAKRDSEKIVLNVTDTGIGMDEDTRLRVFQLFFTKKGYEPGRGLGMSNVLTLVREHKGAIEVKRSAPGKGTTFEICLPFVEVEKAVSSKEANVEQIKFAKVLWVDDEEAIRKLGARMLEKMGHSTDIAASGQEAIQLLESNQYDLMITDIGMEGMSGFQLIERIKGKYPNMKIAVVSGWGAEISENEKNERGVGYIIGKPMARKQVEDLVREVMQMK